MTTTKKLSDSVWARWSALLIVSFTMMAAYYVNDIMAPLKSMMEGQLGWTSGEYGFYTGAYSFLNVWIVMLIWGGLILDKFGIRFTGMMATILMVAGTGAEYYAFNYMAGTGDELMGYKADVFIASAGFSVFGVGAEVAGITVSKIVAKWFAGKELATAMGVQVALARVGSQAAYTIAIPVASHFSLTTPLLIGGAVLVGGMLSFAYFCLMDKKLDTQVALTTESSDEDKFSFSDVVAVISNPGFWLIALLCVLFYSCVFPFQKFATELMITKYNVAEELAGFFVGLPALGALILTPVFGGMIDKKGKAASIMMLGAAMLICVHGIYALPFIHAWWVAILLMITLGIAFSLVPSAMWPSVAKIFPVKQLGTAYALIFYVQNIGLWGIPFLIGSVLENYCIIDQQIVDGKECNIYDYTLPMCIFTGIAFISLFTAFLLKLADKKYKYGLEEANIK